MLRISSPQSNSTLPAGKTERSEKKLEYTRSTSSGSTRQDFVAR